MIVTAIELRRLGLRLFMCWKQLDREIAEVEDELTFCIRLRMGSTRSSERSDECRLSETQRCSHGAYYEKL